jgi:hypothetical protein
MTDERIDEVISYCVREQIYFWWNEGKEELMPARRFSSDLNAMHHAEKFLSANQLLDYIGHLPKTWEQTVCATPRQRAEAFLRTLGKWEEAK